MEYYILDCGYTDRLLTADGDFVDRFDELINEPIFLLEEINSKTVMKWPENCEYETDLNELLEYTYRAGYFGRGVICVLSNKINKLTLLNRMKDIDFCEIYSIEKTVTFNLSSGMPVNYISFDSESG